MHNLSRVLQMLLATRMAGKNSVEDSGSFVADSFRDTQVPAHLRSYPVLLINFQTFL